MSRAQSRVCTGIAPAGMAHPLITLSASFVLRYARVYWPHQVNTIRLGLREIPFPCHGGESIVTAPGIGAA